MGGDVAAAPEFATKPEMYAWLAKQAELLVEDMSRKFTPQANLTMGLANVGALYFYELNRFAEKNAPLQNLPVNWFGFYLLQAPGLLGLGPFQGRPACTQIRVGRGVCGTAADACKTQVVPNVHDFPGHIACDSASESEVVVPLLLENGSCVGVIDTDSTVVNHFDAEDGRGLEALAAVLMKHLTFPMSHALGVNPALAFSSFSPMGGLGGRPVTEVAAVPFSELSSERPPVDEVQLPLPPPTTVSGIPHFVIDVVRPEEKTALVSGWRFTTTRLERIMNQEEQHSMEESLGVSALPEIPFPFNTLKIAAPNSDPSTTAGEAPNVLSFDLLSLLQNAKLFYRSDVFRNIVKAEFVIPVSESWAQTPYSQFDPNIDWAWRNDYLGLHAGSVARAVVAPADTEGINWELLKDQSLPIRMFDSFDLFEDDIHDHGIAKCSVKFRVMDSAFFILFRHFIRVNGFKLWARDVRFYHEFGKTRTCSTTNNTIPHVIALEQIRQVSLEASQGAGDAEGSAAALRDKSVDELLAAVPPHRETLYVIEC